MNDRIKAIIAHITIIGWVIALLMHLSSKKSAPTMSNAFGGTLNQFYLRQMLGVFIFSLVNMLPLGILNLVLATVLFAAWLYSLAMAIQEKRVPLPFVGEYFQKWFDFI
ncbi:MAG: hypothetical protein ACWA5U_07290 [bacterium]